MFSFRRRREICRSTLVMNMPLCNFFSGCVPWLLFEISGINGAISASSPVPRNTTPTVFSPLLKSSLALFGYAARKISISSSLIASASCPFSFSIKNTISTSGGFSPYGANPVPFFQDPACFTFNGFIPSISLIASVTLVFRLSICVIFSLVSFIRPTKRIISLFVYSISMLPSWIKPLSFSTYGPLSVPAASTVNSAYTDAVDDASIF